VNHTVLPGRPSPVSTPHLSERASTISRPRPVGSEGLGDWTTGLPEPPSVTSTRTISAVRSTTSSKPVPPWRTQLVASSETINSTA